jgi:DNA-binding Xre family transcriptional regulator
VAKIVSRARQLRLQLSAREGKVVTIEEAAERAGIDRKALSRLENGETERFDGPMLLKLCALYGVGIGEILEIDPDSIQMPELVAA